MVAVKKISPIKPSFGVGVKPKVVFREDGLDITFFSPSENQLLIFTDQGWKPQSTDPDAYNRIDGYTLYARHYKHLPEGEKEDLILQNETPVDGQDDVAPLVISYEHAAHFSKKRAELEEQKLNTKINSPDFKLSKAYASMAASVATVTRHASQTSEIESVTAKSTGVHKSPAVSYADIQDLSPAERQFIDQNKDTMTWDKIIEKLKEMLRFSKNDNTPRAEL